jgi:DNA-binding PadR family transcriptional regulator
MRDHRHFNASHGRDHAAHPGFADSFSLHRLWHAWQAIGRHHHPRGGRFPGGGPGGFGDEGDGFPRGRKFTSDDLQLLLLALIDEQPSHGYELIKALEARSNGFYSPSPGMVYPALTYLEELGYVTVQMEGNRKRYELADAGHGYLAANRERADLMLAKLSHIARKMDMVRRAFAGDTVGTPGGDEFAGAGGNAWLPEFIEARRALKHALLMRDNASPDEQRRITAILARATAEIERKTDSEDKA